MVVLEVRREAALVRDLLGLELVEDLRDVPARWPIRSDRVLRTKDRIEKMK